MFRCACVTPPSAPTSPAMLTRFASWWVTHWPSGNPGCVKTTALGLAALESRFKMLIGYSQLRFFSSFAPCFPVARCVFTPPGRCLFFLTHNNNTYGRLKMIKPLHRLALAASCLVLSSQLLAEPKRPECIAPAAPGGGFDLT